MIRARTLAVTLTLCAALPAAAKERSEIPDVYKWNLSELYPSPQAWEAARAALVARLPSLARHQGHLGEGPAALRAALDDVFRFDRDLARLGVYAQSRSDEDTRVASAREATQAAQALGVDYGAATAWLRPEIIALGPARVKAFQEADPKLAPYAHFLADVLRWKPHMLDARSEKLLAQAGMLTDTGASIYGVLKDADLPWRTVKLSTGEAVRMDPSAFTLHRASPVKADRDAAFDAYLGALHDFEGSFGATMYAQARADVFGMRARGFQSSMEAALFHDAIPPQVYRQLVADVHRNLPTLHRYLALRKKLMGLDVLRYQDLYVPVVPAVDLTYAPEEARKLTLEAVAPLGEAYVKTLARGFESGWTDYLPSTGKRSGAYSTGAYGVHPYQLLNFNGKYDDLSTLAHESGHSMHTWLSMKAQPYPTADYSIFVAEVASTLNEDLLVHDQLARAKDDATRLFLLSQQLDRLRTTLFRQVQFAEFELRAHELAEKGEALTGEKLSRLYLGLTREYYGHAKGVCQVDDKMGVEWAGVPHFYQGFYVYQYATSIVASASIAEHIRAEAAKGETRARDAYLRMLSSGSSKDPIDLLRGAGVDMTTSAPFDAAIAEMNAVMDELERVLARRG